MASGAAVHRRSPCNAHVPCHACRDPTPGASDDDADTWLDWQQKRVFTLLGIPCQTALQPPPRSTAETPVPSDPHHGGADIDTVRTAQPDSGGRSGASGVKRSRDPDGPAGAAAGGSAPATTIAKTAPPKIPVFPGLPRARSPLSYSHPADLPEPPCCPAVHVPVPLSPPHPAPLPPSRTDHDGLPRPPPDTGTAPHAPALMQRNPQSAPAGDSDAPVDAEAGQAAAVMGVVPAPAPASAQNPVPAAGALVSTQPPCRVHTAQYYVLHANALAEISRFTCMHTSAAFTGSAPTLWSSRPCMLQL